MELNNPFKSKVYIILIVILSLTGLISLFLNIILNKSSVIECIDLNKSITTNKELTDYLNNKKIPIDILKYIDKDKLKELSIDIIDKLYDNNSNLINSNVLNDLIKESIIKYEEKENADIYNNIKEDIEKITINISNNINNEEYVNRYNIIKNVNYLFFIPLIISIVFIILLFINEKKKALLISGLIGITISLVLDYLKTQLVKVLYNNLDIINMLGITFEKSSIRTSSIISGIIIVISLILIVIYLLIEGRHLYRKIRTSYLDKYY